MKSCFSNTPSYWWKLVFHLHVPLPGWQNQNLSLPLPYWKHYALYLFIPYWCKLVFYLPLLYWWKLVLHFLHPYWWLLVLHLPHPYLRLLPCSIVSLSQWCREQLQTVLAASPLNQAQDPVKRTNKLLLKETALIHLSVEFLNEEYSVEFSNVEYSYTLHCIYLLRDLKYGTILMLNAYTTILPQKRHVHRHLLPVVSINKENGKRLSNTG